MDICSRGISILRSRYSFAIILPAPELNLFCSQVLMSAPSLSLRMEPCK